MRALRRTFPLLLPLLAFGFAAPGPRADGQEAAQAPAAAPAPEERWTVGVSALDAQGLAPEDAYLTRSLPQLIREKLSSILAHTLSPDERKGMEAELLGRERRNVLGELGRAREERDALLFQDLREEERSRRQATLDGRIRELEERLRALETPAEAGGAAPGLPAVPEELPVDFLQGKEEGGLLPPPAFSPLRFARQQGAELLIWGTIQPLADYLFLEIRVMDAPLEKQVYDYRDAVQREEIYTVLGEVTDRLAEIVLGRPWSGLAIPGLPADCEVWLDDRFVGTGLERMLYLAPGEHGVRIVCPQGREQTARLTLQPGRVEELALDLRERPPDRIRLDSRPTGAQVYAGSLFLGTTPLELDRPALKTRILLHRDGFGDTVLYLDPRAPATIEQPLAPLIADPVALQAQQRGRFYRSFGIWALSFPLPFFLYAATVDYAIAAQAALNDGNAGEAQRLARLGQITWYSYLGGLGLSVGLFANMAVQLWKYVQSADRKAR